jgi:hypothetical protein
MMLFEELMRGRLRRAQHPTLEPRLRLTSRTRVALARKVSDVGNFRLRICRQYQRSGSTRQLTCHIGVGAMNVSRHLPESGRICTTVRMVEPFQ